MLSFLPVTYPKQSTPCHCTCLITFRCIKFFLPIPNIGSLLKPPPPATLPLLIGTTHYFRILKLVVSEIISASKLCVCPLRCYYWLYETKNDCLQTPQNYRVLCNSDNMSKSWGDRQMCARTYACTHTHTHTHKDASTQCHYFQSVHFPFQEEK
jgi:hypothetical protein